MGDIVRRDSSHKPQTMQIRYTVEQTLPLTKQHRSQTDLHFIHQPGDQILLSRLGSSGKRNVLRPGSTFSPLQSAFDSIGHEEESRSSFERERLARVVRQNKNWVMIRRIVSPPAVPRIIRIPWTRMTTEHVSSHDRRA